MNLVAVFDLARIKNEKKTALSWTMLSIYCLIYKLWRVLAHD